MKRYQKAIMFVLRSTIVGLAVAFVIVLLRPELIPATRKADAALASGFADAVSKSAPAVANVYTVRWVGGPANIGRIRSQTALGSAVVIDAEGHLVTNNHLIESADEIWVQLADGRVSRPRLVGTDPETDIALLKIDLSDLPKITLGRSDSLAIGDIVLAIGNPYGLSQTVTQGIVSATGRGLLGLTSFENFIQTDAAINTGNSGGALINARGELVGINTATLAQDQSTEGISFAIPVNLVRGVVRDLLDHGRVIRGWLGLVPEPRILRRDAFAELGIEGDTGLLLNEVYVNSPGWVAGLRRNDIVTHLNEVPIQSQQQALLLVAGLKPGDRVGIRGYRRQQAFETEAIAGERPAIPN